MLICPFCYSPYKANTLMLKQHEKKTAHLCKKTLYKILQLDIAFLKTELCKHFVHENLALFEA